MDIKAFFELVYEFVKNLLKYLGEWPLADTTDPEA